MSDSSPGELERLRAIEERHRLLFMNMSAAFIVYEVLPDETGHVVDARVLEANAACERLMHVAPGSLVGRTMREAVPFFDPKWLVFIANVARTGVSEQRLDYIRNIRYRRRIAYSRPHLDGCRASFRHRRAV